MQLVDRKIVLETRPCLWCDGKRKVHKWVDCPRCKGEGEVPDRRRKTPGGFKSRKCPYCKPKAGPRDWAYGKVLKGGFTCSQCTDGTQPETMTDTVPFEIWLAMRFKIYRYKSGPGLGHGITPVYSCFDYGAWRDLSDIDLLMKVVRDKMHLPQVCKIADKDGNLYDHVGIFCGGKSGYSGYEVVAMRGDEECLLEKSGGSA